MAITRKPFGIFEDNTRETLKTLKTSTLSTFKKIFNKLKVFRFIKLLMVIWKFFHYMYYIVHYMYYIVQSFKLTESEWCDVSISSFNNDKLKD